MTGEVMLHDTGRPQETGPRIETETDTTLTVRVTFDKRWAREVFLFFGALMDAIAPGSSRKRP
jgi:hypothetical protein